MCVRALSIYINGEALRARVPRDEAPPWWKWNECSSCGGTGQQPLFTSLIRCHECDGRGGWNTTDTEALAEMLDTEEGRALYVAEQRRGRAA